MASRGGQGTPAKVVVETGGAVSGNDQAAGIGVHFPDGEGPDVSAPFRGPPTKDEAELAAARRGVREAREVGFRSVELHTDSRLVVDGMNVWRHEWEANGWRNSSGEFVANKDAYEALIRETRGMELTFTHIPREDNSRADAFAQQGARMDKSATEDQEYRLDDPCHMALRLNGRPVAIQLRSVIEKNVMTEALVGKLGLAESVLAVGPGTMAHFGPLSWDCRPATGLLKGVRVEVAGLAVLQDFVVAALPHPNDRLIRVRLGAVGIAALGATWPFTHSTINGVEFEMSSHRVALRKAKELADA